MMYPDVKSNKYECVKYNDTGIPLYFKKGMLSSYPDYAAQVHWHDDFEFIVVLSGKMQYSVNGEILTVEPGNGIFVNSRQFHFGFSSDYSECEFLCVLAHPILLSSSQRIEQEYVAPILTDSTLPYLVLHKNVAWENKILNALSDIFLSDSFEKIVLLYQIWNELCHNIKNISRQNGKINSKLTVLKSMISYVQENYKHKICLGDIARVGAMGKTECCNVFSAYTNRTPIDFLNGYRLRKGADLLKNTDLTICEICYEVGFSSASYFSESFKKTFHCTPKEYRKNRLR